MWTNENRSLYDRSHLRYPSDLTDEEWALIEPLIPPAKGGGGKRTVIMREVVNGVMYVLSTGCQWRALPKDLPPRSMVHGYFDLWNWDGTLERIHHTLYVKCREQAGREASATAAIIDSQSVKSAEKGGACIDPCGYDAGKKIKGKKRHILVDTQGLLMHAIIHAADIQDRGGGILVMATLFGLYPFLLKLYADGGYQGPHFQAALKRVFAVLCSTLHHWNIEPPQALVYDTPSWKRRLSWRRHMLLARYGRNARRYLAGSSVWRRNCASGGRI